MNSKAIHPGMQMGEPLVELNGHLAQQLRKRDKTLPEFAGHNGRIAVRCSDLKDWLMTMKTHSNHVAIHELLQDCEVFFQPPQPRPRNPELAARLERLKAQQEKKEYDRMTENVSALSKVWMLLSVL
jgi:hypothetical protein